MKFDKCPCGSGVGFNLCCGGLVEGTRVAETAEQLMRSRYTAYVLKKVSYLVETTCPASRAPDLEKSIRSWMKKVEWIKLHVVARDAGLADDEEGRVEFVAEFMTNDGVGQHHECSVFKKEKGQWFYVGEEFDE